MCEDNGLRLEMVAHPILPNVDCPTLVTCTGTNTEPFTLCGQDFENEGALVINGSNYFIG